MGDEEKPDKSDKIDKMDRGSTRVILNQGLCEHTGVCEQLCPEDVFLNERGMTRVIREQNCTYCWICVENCIAGAITLE